MSSSRPASSPSSRSNGRAPASRRSWSAANKSTAPAGASLNIEGGFLDTIATTPFTVTLDLLFGLAVCTYLVLRVAYPGFRLKRMLFNLHPGPSEELRSSAVQPHVTAVDGVYRLESDVLAALGVRPQREFPFDLAVSTFGAVLFTAISASIVIDGDSTGFSMVVCGAARLAWLARAEHRRLRCAPLPATTAEPIRALAPS